MTSFASGGRGVAFCLCIGVASFAILNTGCGEKEKENQPIVSVEVTRVAKAPIQETVAAEAVIFPAQQAVVAPKITSTIKKFLVQRGTRVHKGQLLAVLESRDLSAATEQSKGELEQAEAQYSTTTGASLPQQIQKAELDAASAKVALDAQQKVYDSRRELFQQGALPRRDLDTAEVQLAQAKGQCESAQRQLADLKRIGERDTLKSAAGQLAAAHGKYEGATAQLGYSEIRSPIDGVVADRPQYPGEVAAANQPLVTVIDTSKLIAKAHIAQSEATLIKDGDVARVQAYGTDRAVEGRVSLVSPALDPGSTTIEVWVEVNKPLAALKPGMTAQLSITTRSAASVLVVSTPSVFKNDSGADFVMVATADHHAEQKNIQIGIHNTDFSQIIAGLKEGDAVITSGGYALPDKTLIRVETRDKDTKDKAEPDSGKAE